MEEAHKEGGDGWPLADLWGVGPGQEKDKSGGEKGLGE